MFGGKASYYGCAMAFKRELKEVILTFPKYMESYDTWIAMAANLLKSNVHLEYTVLEHRLHGNNVTKSHRKLGKRLHSRILFLQGHWANCPSELLDIESYREENNMIRPNMHYSELKDSYLFYNIAQKTKAYVEQHPGVKLLRMGIGDVSLPLCDAVIKALHEAVDDQASKSSFHGYMPECGASFLRDTIAKYYENKAFLRPQTRCLFQVEQAMSLGIF